jgi:hypothetical protein
MRNNKKVPFFRFQAKQFSLRFHLFRFRIKNEHRTLLTRRVLTIITLRCAGKTGKMIRLVRVMRILRIFKLVRHFAGLQSLFYTLQQASFNSFKHISVIIEQVILKEKDILYSRVKYCISYEMQQGVSVFFNNIFAQKARKDI